MSDIQKSIPGIDMEDDSLERCRVCGEAKEMFITFRGKGGANERNRMRRSCRCEREETEKLKAMEAEREAFFEIQRLKSESLIPKKYEGVRLSTFQLREDNQEVFDIARGYIDKFPKMQAEGKGLLFHGPVGTGKTFTAAMIANILIEWYRVPVVMTSIIDIMNRKRETAWGKEDTTKKFLNAPLLILDDLGAERGSDYALEVTYDVIDSRYNEEKPMILTTNLLIKQIVEEKNPRTARVYDRILERCCPVRFSGASWRRERATRNADQMRKELLGA